MEIRSLLNEQGGKKRETHRKRERENKYIYISVNDAGTTKLRTFECVSETDEDKVRTGEEGDPPTKIKTFHEEEERKRHTHTQGVLQANKTHA